MMCVCHRDVNATVGEFLLNPPLGRKTILLSCQCSCGIMGFMGVSGTIGFLGVWRGILGSYSLLFAFMFPCGLISYSWAPFL